ncbi:NADH dehydrogenase [Sphingomonas panacis]|uniref:NADH dehydrogenase n=1 Tax=Sphingomonas panacis TaxID=1560345 RepID=A0A1B3Z794_9SPHN|nr:nitroreductase [Sphingomonas panacis]AOH83292.1 NADH dehydrogenase [Sphingomonas panacis]
MHVSDAVQRRKSVRAFQPRLVDVDEVLRLLALAARTPSGGNLQPWHIHLIGGDSLRRFKLLMSKQVTKNPRGEGTEFSVYPPDLASPYRERVFGIGEQLYASIGIARDDKSGRRRQFDRNFQFFDAPLGLFCFVNRSVGLPQWADLGMFLQTLMLLLTEAGLGCCAQESWARYHHTVSSFLGSPPEQMLFCGMAIGYADETAAINHWRSPRIAAEDFVALHQ